MFKIDQQTEVISMAKALPTSLQVHGKTSERILQELQNPSGRIHNGDYWQDMDDPSNYRDVLVSNIGNAGVDVTRFGEGEEWIAICIETFGLAIMARSVFYSPWNIASVTSVMNGVQTGVHEIDMYVHCMMKYDVEVGTFYKKMGGTTIQWDSSTTERDVAEYVRKIANKYLKSMREIRNDLDATIKDRLGKTGKSKKAIKDTDKGLCQVIKAASQFVQMIANHSWVDKFKLSDPRAVLSLLRLNCFRAGYHCDKLAFVFCKIKITGPNAITAKLTMDTFIKMMDKTKSSIQITDRPVSKWIESMNVRLDHEEFLSNSHYKVAITVSSSAGRTTKSALLKGISSQDFTENLDKVYSNLHDETDDQKGRIVVLQFIHGYDGMAVTKSVLQKLIKSLPDCLTVKLLRPIESKKPSDLPLIQLTKTQVQKPTQKV